MAIEEQQTITLASTEVSDAYQVELTVRDSLSGTVATVSLSWSQTQDLVDELLKTNADAVSAFWEDRAQQSGVVHAFDQGVPRCPECVAGKCRNCDGTAWDGAVDKLTQCGSAHGPVAA